MGRSDYLLGSYGNGFLPTDIAGCILWLPADYIVGLSDGDPITTWEDQSGNGNDLTQTTANKKPTYRIVDGLATVDFDGTDDQMDDGGAITTSNAFSIFFVVNTHTVGSNRGLLGWGTDSSSRGVCYFAYNATSKYLKIHTGAGTSDGQIIVDPDENAWITLGLWHDPSIDQCGVRVDGAETTDPTTDPNIVTFGATPKFMLGSRPGYGDAFDGGIRQVVAYNKHLNAEETALLEPFLDAYKT